MKKVLLSAVAMMALTMSVTAQGNFSTLTSGYYKVHVYEPTDKSQPKALIVEGDKGLVVIAEKDVNVVNSARNLPDVDTIVANGINTYDVMNYDNIVITEEAVKMLEEVLK